MQAASAADVMLRRVAACFVANCGRQLRRRWLLIMAFIGIMCNDAATVTPVDQAGHRHAIDHQNVLQVCPDVGLILRNANVEDWPGCEELDIILSDISSEHGPVLARANADTLCAVMNSTASPITDNSLSGCTAENCMVFNLNHTQLPWLHTDVYNTADDDVMFVMIGCQATHTDAVPNASITILQVHNSTWPCRLDSLCRAWHGSRRAACSNDSIPIAADDQGYVARKKLPIYGLSVALAFITISFFCYLIFSELRQETSNVMFLHQCAAISLLIVMEIVRIEVERTILSCTLVGVAIEFSLLVIFAWSTAQAVYLHRHIASAHKPEIQRYVVKACAPCYGLPALITFLSPAIYKFDMGTLDDPTEGAPLACHTGLTVSGIFGIIVPLMLEVLVNSVLFFHIMYIAWKQSAKGRPNANTTPGDHDFRKYLHYARVSGSIFLLVGFTWIAGGIAIFVDITTTDIVLMAELLIWGTFIFLTKLPLDRKVRDMVKKRWRRWKGIYMPSTLIVHFSTPCDSTPGRP
eukprot:scpid64740/ scgid2402/ Latrophilin-2; Calcium-independent alpha-latrotoxin receptor 2